MLFCVQSRPCGIQLLYESLSSTRWSQKYLFCSCVYLDWGNLFVMELPKKFNSVLHSNVPPVSPYQDDKINKCHNHYIPHKFLLSPQSDMKWRWTEKKESSLNWISSLRNQWINKLVTCWSHNIYLVYLQNNQHSLEIEGDRYRNEIWIVQYGDMPNTMPPVSAFVENNKGPKVFSPFVWSKRIMWRY